MAFLGLLGLVCSIIFIAKIFIYIWNDGFFGEKTNLPRNRKGWW
jgi:hypothetical protein